MSITYTYEIVAVDEPARCMQIVYSSEGREPIRVGARLPFEGEALESVVEMYSPVHLWIAMETPVQVPAVGTSGTIAPTIEPVTAAAPVDQPTVLGAQTL